MSTFDRNDELAPLDDQSPDQEQSSTMPLLAGVGGAEEMPSADMADFDSGSKTGNPLLSQLIVLGLAGAIGLVTLFVMYRAGVDVGPDQSTQALEQQITATLDKWRTAVTGQPGQNQDVESFTNDLASYVALLQVDHTATQVPLEYLKKDPFDLGVKAPKPDAPAADPNQNRRAFEREHERLQREARGYQLQSVMINQDEPVAIIDGDFYRVGQTLGSFKVAKIGKDRVGLIVGEHRFVIKMN